MKDSDGLVIRQNIILEPLDKVWVYIFDVFFLIKTLNFLASRLLLLPLKNKYILRKIFEGIIVKQN